MQTVASERLASGDAALEVPSITVLHAAGVVDCYVAEARVVLELISRWGTRSTSRERRYIAKALRPLRRAVAVDLPGPNSTILPAVAPELLHVTASSTPLRDMGISSEQLNAGLRSGTLVAGSSSVTLAEGTGLVRGSLWPLLKHVGYWGPAHTRARLEAGAALALTELLPATRSRPAGKMRAQSLVADMSAVWTLMSVYVELRDAYEAAGLDVPEMLRKWTHLPRRFSVHDFVLKGASAGEREVSAVPEELVIQKFAELADRVGWGRHDPWNWPSFVRSGFQDFRRLVELLLHDLGLRIEQIEMLDTDDLRRDHRFRDGTIGWGLCIDGHKGKAEEDQRWIPLAETQALVLIAWIVGTGRSYGQVAPLVISFKPASPGEPGKRHHGIRSSVAGRPHQPSPESKTKVVNGEIPLICRGLPWKAHQLPPVGWSFPDADFDYYEVLQREEREEGVLVMLQRVGNRKRPRAQLTAPLKPAVTMGPTQYRLDEDLRDEADDPIVNPYVGYASHEYRHGLSCAGDEAADEWKRENKHHPYAGASAESFTEALVDHVDGSVKARYRQARARTVREAKAGILNKRLWARHGLDPKRRVGLDPGWIARAREDLRRIEHARVALASEIIAKRAAKRRLRAKMREASNSESRARLADDLAELSDDIDDLTDERDALSQELADAGAEFERAKNTPVEMIATETETEYEALLEEALADSAPLPTLPDAVPLADELTVHDVAEVCGRSDRQVRRWIMADAGPWIPGSWRLNNGNPRDRRLPHECLRGLTPPQEATLIDVRRRRARTGY